MLWVLVGLSAVEMVVIHGLLLLWRPWIAVVASAVSLAGIGWLVAAIRSFRRLPVVVGPDTLTMRVGRLRSLSVPVAAVAGLRTEWTAQELKRADVLNLTLVAWPNVMVALDPPQPTDKRRIAAVAHRVDDPAGFADAIRALGEGR